MTGKVRCSGVLRNPQCAEQAPVIQLHADFLETNFLSQIRALPNPTSAIHSKQAHPLVLHITATSTVNIVVSSLAPAPSRDAPFAKTAPNAEVIVAPKTRPRLSEKNRSQTRSITGGSRKSVGDRSNASKVKSHSRGEAEGRKSVYLRPIDKKYCDELFDDQGADETASVLAVWVGRDVLAHRPLLGLDWVTVSLVKPAGLEPPLDPQQQQKEQGLKAGDASGQATKTVGKLLSSDWVPDDRHAILSSELCKTLGAEGLIGGLVRIEAAPPPISKSTIRALKIRPFAVDEQPQGTSLRFGGNKDVQNEAIEATVRRLYLGTSNSNPGILDGPLTNGLLLPEPKQPSVTAQWKGGLIQFDFYHDDPHFESLESQRLNWVLGPVQQLRLEVHPEIPNLSRNTRSTNFQSGSMPPEPPSMIGVASAIDELMFHLSHHSSVILTGGLGSGKTCMTQLLGLRLRSSHLYHTSYFPCSKLMTDETRISTIKETLHRIFKAGSWGARHGGQALVILDDLDKLCPVETELQVGNDNSRSRQVSELVCSVVRQYCTTSSSVVLLATAQSKESLHNVIVGGHIVKEFVHLNAPNKDSRRQILRGLVGVQTEPEFAINGVSRHSRNSSGGDSAAWMDGSAPGSPGFLGDAAKFTIDRDVDFLDLAGQTEGFMPGDIVLLISRARSEALIRSLDSTSDITESSVILSKDDFQRALDGFVPASLRNVTLQSSKTSFDSIGGLRETRKILLETLQYPTTYAPIFAQCPLRLRSGLLLYGYPGCGKTLLASAVAGECGLNFISVKGPEILNKYIGASEKSVRDLFERAESARPCVLFFDEFDSIAPKRGHDSTGVTDRVVNQLLTQMDGAEGLTGVYVLAATSRPDLIDPALLRPGRLDKSIICDLPNLEERLDILRALSKKLSINPKVLQVGKNPRGTLLEVAHRTEGYSGADLQAVVYNAHLEAIHDILGDQKTDALAEKPKRREHRKAVRSSGQRDFLQFPFGEESPVVGDISRPRQLVDNAAIIAKLEDLKVAKRRERQIRRGEDPLEYPVNSRSDSAHMRDGNSAQEVIIQWKHVEASLATTRSSISMEERNRLERIYREFVLGRNGEMPKGEGPREVGGRSSLM